MLRYLIYLTVGVLLISNRCHCIRVATFNIQVFGQKKMGNEPVKRNIIKILKRYDLVFIQEIRDASEKAFKLLVEELNSAGKIKYQFTASSRLGKTSSKEQYGVIYNPKLVTVKETYQYPDPENHFERPPFAVLLSFPGKSIAELIVIVTHIDPDHVIRELNELAAATDEIQSRWKKTVMVLGDMNADCTYLPKSRRSQVLFIKGTEYVWLVKDGMDTTVGAKDCAYDRVIVKYWKKERIGVDGVRVYRFDEELKLSMDDAKAISDHYPVEFQLN